jgi:hypothetical protein
MPSGKTSRRKVITPGRYNITAYQGATYGLSLNWSIGGTAVDLTNYTAAMQVREAYNASAPVLSLTNGSGITLGGTAGTIDISVSASTMGSIVAGQYLYDLELNSGSAITRLVQGNFSVEAEVTR